jgi:hypothetical protein
MAVSLVAATPPRAIRNDATIGRAATRIGTETGGSDTFLRAAPTRVAETWPKALAKLKALCEKRAH